MVKPQHCLLPCTTPTDFEEARMLPPTSAPTPSNHQLMVRKDEVFYISSSMYHPKSLPSKTLLLPDPLVSFSTAALLFFQFSSDTGKYNIFIKEGIGI